MAPRPEELWRWFRAAAVETVASGMAWSAGLDWDDPEDISALSKERYREKAVAVLKRVPIPADVVRALDGGE